MKRWLERRAKKVFLSSLEGIEGGFLELACPDNLVGNVGLFLVTHHGADPGCHRRLGWSQALCRGVGSPFSLVVKACEQ